MKRICALICICFLLSGCNLLPAKKSTNIWWGARGDTEAWEKAKVVMENYNWIVIAADMEQ